MKYIVEFLRCPGEVALYVFRENKETPIFSANIDTKDAEAKETFGYLINGALVSISHALVADFLEGANTEGLSDFPDE